MKRTSHSGHIMCWILMVFLLSMLFTQGKSQPQNYFKGNSVSEFLVRNSKNKITQLPSKALPRIGRRDGRDNVFTKSDKEFEQEEKSLMKEFSPGYFTSEQMGDIESLPEAEAVMVHPPFFNNHYEYPSLLILIKQLLKRNFEEPNNRKLQTELE